MQTQQRNEYLVVMCMAITAESEPQAAMDADALRVKVMDELDADDGEECWVAQVTELGAPTSDWAAIDRLVTARNLLIRLKTHESLDTARVLDSIIHSLRVRAGDTDTHPRYDPGKFLPTAELVLKGENPV